MREKTSRNVFITKWCYPNRRRENPWSVSGMSKGKWDENLCHLINTHLVRWKEMRIEMIKKKDQKWGFVWKGKVSRNSDRLMRVFSSLWVEWGKVGWSMLQFVSRFESFFIPCVIMQNKPDDEMNKGVFNENLHEPFAICVHHERWRNSFEW